MSLRMISATAVAIAFLLPTIQPAMATGSAASIKLHSPDYALSAMKMNKKISKRIHHCKKGRVLFHGKCVPSKISY